MFTNLRVKINEFEYDINLNKERSHYYLFGFVVNYIYN